MKRGLCVENWQNLRGTEHSISNCVLVWSIHSLVVAVECVWNVMAHAQKPYFVFRRNGRVHLNRWGRHFSLLLEAEVYASAAVMLDTPCSEVVWRVFATHSIRQFTLHFPSRVSPCAITFQLDYNSSEFTSCIVHVDKYTLRKNGWGACAWKNTMPGEVTLILSLDFSSYRMAEHKLLSNRPISKTERLKRKV